VRKVILYGSYAKNEQREHSDIDVVVVVDEIGNDFLDSASKLFKLAREIDDSIEPKLLEDKYDPSGFLEHITTTGITVYRTVEVPTGK
jgi:predicted nucleotidyltransferase